MWFSKQHYANELAKLGHLVYFINPTKKWKWKNLFSFSIQKEKINDNLIIINYQNNFPQGNFSKFFVRLNDVLNSIKIKKHISLNKNELIWWKFDPYRFLITYPLNKAKHIYHVVDPHAHLWQNKIQAQMADLIVSSSVKYIENYKKLDCENLIHVPHGISNDEYDLDDKKVKELEFDYGDFVVIVGRVGYDVSLDLLKRIGEEGINLIIIGSIQADFKMELEKFSCVHFLGEKHAKELKNYIAAAKVGLIAYNFISIQKGQVSRSPLKALNYLAQKIPIVTSIDSEIQELNTKVIYWVKDENEYIEYVKKGVNSKLEVDIESVDLYLRRHEYPSLIRNILNQLNK